MMIAKHATQFIHQMADWSNNDVDEDDNIISDDNILLFNAIYASQHCDTVTNKTKDILATVKIESIF